jgi:hypothetical protein
MTAIDYYENESQWGQYQYVTLEEVINNFMMSRDIDDFTSMSSRAKVIYHAKRGLREFYYDVLQEVQGIELELSPTLQVTLPPDYVNYVRISWVDEKGQLHPMAMDDRMSIAKEYLQGSDYELLFDDEGCVLIGQDENISSETPFDPNMDLASSYSYSFCSQFSPNANMSNYFAKGKYKIDKNRGIIQFGSDAMGRHIVLEYISDGLYTGCEGRPEAQIRVNKFAESALINYIYYELIKQRRNVPANEKGRARKEYYNSMRIAKLRINALRKSEILQAFKGQSKWIK